MGPMWLNLSKTKIRYENKDKHQDFTWKPLRGKNHGHRRKFHYEYENDYKVQENKELIILC